MPGKNTITHVWQLCVDDEDFLIEAENLAKAAQKSSILIADKKLASKNHSLIYRGVLYK